ncbi:MAG TPA: hypothetical protein VH877_07535 [Polyangia bacterium]|jgi:hypothetical protein|nr:hypothetical protein [Polyangia bacterium]
MEIATQQATDSLPASDGDKESLGQRVKRQIVAEETRSQRINAMLGVILGVSFAISFVTGLLSHIIQEPISWLEWPARPHNLYRWLTATHATTGVATIPWLLTKLWGVYPKLWHRLDLRNLPHLLERVSLVPLVGGALWLMTSGMGDHFYWFKNPRFFTPTHYWAAWITVGALFVHVGLKIELTWRLLGRKRPGQAGTPTVEGEKK